jgi:hypothetical protein
MKMFEQHWSIGLLLHLFRIGRTLLDKGSAVLETYRLPENKRHPQKASIPPGGIGKRNPSKRDDRRPMPKGCGQLATGNDT